MLIIKTKLKEFPQKGIGLIADQNIKKGEAIWIYHPMIDITIKEKDVPKEAKDFFETYAVEEKKGEYFLNIDNARFMNHSDNPNTKSLGHHKNNITTRNIKKGEELTIDYREIDIDGVDFEDM